MIEIRTIQCEHAGCTTRTTILVRDNGDLRIPKNWHRRYWVPGVLSEGDEAIPKIILCCPEHPFATDGADPRSFLK